MQIKKYLQKFSFDDLAKSFFVINLWLPNVGCPIRIQYLYALLESIHNNLSAEDKIKSFADFEFFCTSLFNLLPSFEMMEDYVPELDWGDVKYYFQGKSYKIFYGGDLSNPYDFYYSYEIIHSAFEKEYLDLIKRSPLVEMKFCLELQDDILTNLSQNIIKTIDNVGPGYIEIPEECFWKKSCEFIDCFRPEDFYSIDALKIYSKALIESIPDFSMKTFIDNASKGRNCRYFFIKKNKRYYPVLPRKWITVFYDNWGILLRDNYGKINEKLNETEINALIGIDLAKFIYDRLNRDNVFRLIKSINSDLKSAHDLTFTAIQAENRIFYIYVTPPLFDQKKINEYLKLIQPKLIESAALIKQEPSRIGLIIEQEIAEFRSNKRGKVLEAFFLIVLPSPLSDTQGVLEVPHGINAEIMTLDQFVGVIDEVLNPKELSDFIDYLSEENKLARISAQNSFLDRYASFKYSHGVLVPGAINPDQILLDPNMGSNFRFNTLKKFWASFPEEGFFWHPRSWTISNEMKTKAGLILNSKVFLGYAYYQKINKTSFYINSPVHLMEFEEGRINDSILLSLFDLINIYMQIVEKLNFTKSCNKVHIFLCPSSLVLRKNELAHVKHLVPDNNLWEMDGICLALGDYGIRVVYNFENIIDKLKNVEDRSIQIGLFIDILEQLNVLILEPNLDGVKRELEKEKGKKARFKTYILDKLVSFPEGIVVLLPGQREFRLADKEIAKTALGIGILPGIYLFEDGKEKANCLRNNLVQIVNSKIKNYNLIDAIPILLEKANALANDFWETQAVINASLIHEVDYERDSRLSEKEKEFIHWYGVFRYLIEKYVQLQPAGTSDFNDVHLKELLALVDRLINLYSASDLINYGIYPVKINIDRDYLVSISDEKYNIAEMEKKYGEEQAKLELGIIGNQGDTVNSILQKNDYLDELDVAFKKDFNFGLKNFIKLQQVLAFWKDNDEKKKTLIFLLKRRKLLQSVLKE